MKYQFSVWIEGSGPDLIKAYQDMRRKLLGMNGWIDTDEAVQMHGEMRIHVEEEDIQDARRAFPHSKDGKRRCSMEQHTDCKHDVVVFGIPACMMDAREAQRMMNHGHDMVALETQLKTEAAEK